MDHQCALCTLQKECSGTSVFLYATTPILRQIISSHLSELGVDFRLEQELFRIPANQDRSIHALRSRISDAEAADIRVTKEQGAALLAAPLLDQWLRSNDTSWFDRAIHEDAFTTFFQPLVDVRSEQVFAHECLIRLFSDRSYSGGEIIDAALSRGRIHLFDSYARRLSIRKAALQHRPGTKVFVNFMPSSIYDPAFCMRSTLEEISKTNLRPSDIVFEVVESDHVREVKHLRKICDYYRQENFGFALDDVGTGSNSFQMICDIKPDYIKLDKSLISKIEDPMYQAAVGKLSEFADQFGLQTIAEGVEQPATVEKLRTLGIHLMQGYHFGRPAALMYQWTTDLIHLGSSIVSPSSVFSETNA